MVPARRVLDPNLDALVGSQDWVLHRHQALAAGHTQRSISHRLQSGGWQALLPEVYLCHSGDPSRRQLLIAASLYAGPQSAIDGIDACRYHRLRPPASAEDKVHVVVPRGDDARSRDFLVVRRTVAPIETVSTDRLRYLAAAPAVVALARQMRTDRQAIALLSEALQRNVVTHEELVRAHVQATARNARITDRALAALGSGAWSLPEVDFLKLVAASLVLPAPLCNVTLQLPNGRVIKPDALWEDARLVHETNGRVAHARADLFEDMQERHDAMTAAGLTVLHIRLGWAS
jgi:hypothetical protein